MRARARQVIGLVLILLLIFIYSLVRYWKAIPWRAR